MDIEFLNNLYETGALDILFKHGVIRSTIFEQREIYLWVHEQIALRGISKNKAVLEAEQKFKKEEATIWRALKMFQV